MWEEILSAIIKWAVPAILAFLVGFGLKPVFKDISRGRSDRLTEDWNKRAASLIADIASCRSDITDLNNTMTTKSAETAEQFDKLSEQLKESTQGVRDALLTTHSYNLQRDGIAFIKQGYIPNQEWLDYENRMKIYRDLGGNGHMAMIYSQVSQLPKTE